MALRTPAPFKNFATPYSVPSSQRGISKCSSTPYLDCTADQSITKPNANPQAVSMLSSRILQEIDEEMAKKATHKRIALCKVSDSAIWRESQEKRINYEKGVTFKPKVECIAIIT